MHQRKKVRRTVPTSLGSTLAALSNRPATSGEALANRNNPFAALGEASADLGESRVARGEAVADPENVLATVGKGNADGIFRLFLRGLVSVCVDGYALGAMEKKNQRMFI